MLDMLGRMELYQKINPNELSKQQLLNLRQEAKKPNATVISDEYADFKLWCIGVPSRQESFAQFIAKRLSSHKRANILEVGGGRTGRLSRILNAEGFQMTCIDPKLEIADQNNIRFIKGKFDYRKVDLTPYDYVIAQEPCEATEHVARACVIQRKPFLIALCGVPHKLLCGRTPKSVEEWYQYLVNIDATSIKLRYIKLDPLLLTPILKSNQF